MGNIGANLPLTLDVMMVTSKEPCNYLEKFSWSLFRTTKPETLAYFMGMGIVQQLLWKTPTLGEFTDISCAELVHLLNKGRYALISGGNSHEALKNEIEEAGYRVTPATGNYGGRTEPMFLVHDPDVRDMVALGSKYLQHSVVIAEAGRQKMIFTNGPHKGRIRAGRGWKIATGLEGQFTEISTTDGEKVRFSLQF